MTIRSSVLVKNRAGEVSLVCPQPGSAHPLNAVAVALCSAPHHPPPPPRVAEHSRAPRAQTGGGIVVSIAC